MINTAEVVTDTDHGEVVVLIEADMVLNSLDYVADVPCDMQVSQLRGCHMHARL
ncbi:unnamed protein product [Strongylus vulgaris]|uniref:Uncharacterized protein n=1 Tax=Strongylus vulgaris TaxID=40348 RepID=A0A3P7KBA3_STRVU|nr:unnamed protein product [Strongylus vulgaris]